MLSCVVMKEKIKFLEKFLSGGLIVEDIVGLRWCILWIIFFGKKFY